MTEGGKIENTYIEQHGEKLKFFTVHVRWNLQNDLWKYFFVKTK